MACLLGIDIGTTSTIGILVRTSGETLAVATRPVTLSSPRQGWAEENPEDWWANVRALVPDLLGQAGIEAGEIAGIGVTGMLPAVVLLDSEGRLLRPSIQQSDGRCGREVAELRAEVDEAAFVRKAGNGINQQLVTAKLRWIARHEPDVFARIATVFGSYDYINWRLTGRRAVEQNWALEAGFAHIQERALADDLIALAGIPRSALPPMVASHEILGAVTEEAARATGLAAGTPVVGGAADHIASAYAAGIVAPGDVLLKFGGAADIMIATDTAVPDPRMYLDYHLVPGLYMPNGCMASGGSALNWFVERIAAGEAEAARRAGQSPHARLDALAAQTPAGADGVQIVPYFLGEKTPIHDPEARGVVTGLQPNHGSRAHSCGGSLLEGFGYAFRHNVEVFNDHWGFRDAFVPSDGAPRRGSGLQIVARTILGAPVHCLPGHPPGGGVIVARRRMEWPRTAQGLSGNDWAGTPAFIRPGGSGVDPDTRQSGALYRRRVPVRFAKPYRGYSPDIGGDRPPPSPPLCEPRRHRGSSPGNVRRAIAGSTASRCTSGR